MEPLYRELAAKFIDELFGKNDKLSKAEFIKKLGGDGHKHLNHNQLKKAVASLKKDKKMEGVTLTTKKFEPKPDENVFKKLGNTVTFGVFDKEEGKQAEGTTPAGDKATPAPAATGDKVVENKDVKAAETKDDKTEAKPAEGGDKAVATTATAEKKEENDEGKEVEA